jgi:hypothetical protein
MPFKRTAPNGIYIFNDDGSAQTFIPSGDPRFALLAHALPEKGSGGLPGVPSPQQATTPLPTPPTPQNEVSQAQIQRYAGNTGNTDALEQSIKNKIRTDFVVPQPGDDAIPTHKLGISTPGYIARKDLSTEEMEYLIQKNQKNLAASQQARSDLANNEIQEHVNSQDMSSLYTNEGK